MPEPEQLSRARAHMQASAWAEALEELQQVEVQGLEDIAAAEQRWCTGRCLRGLDRLEEALELQTALAREDEESGRASGLVAEELGELYLALGREEEARPWLARAWVLLSSDRVIVQRDTERLTRLQRLAGLGF